MPKPVTQSPPAAALARRRRSIARLRRLGIPTLAELPVIERGKPRSTKAIVERIIALEAVVLRAFAASPELQADYAKAFPSAALLTAEERAFMRAKRPSPSARKAFSWRCEALEVLRWSVGLVARLPALDEQVKPQAQLDELVEHGSPAGLRRAAKPRSHDELLELSDLMYRAHWAVRDAELAGKRPPRNLDRGIVIERDHASRWLLGLGGLAWDDVSLDT